MLLLVSLVLMLAFAFPVSAAPLNSTPHTYTVLVGAENVNRGVGIMAFFPGTLTVHVGDTVTWKVQTHEIHTVTFLGDRSMPDLLVQAPAPYPPGALMLNPDVAFPVVPAGGLYDGTSYANSGILSTDPGQLTDFSLTFTQTGVFPYVCVVHGMMMSGTITVVGPSVAVRSPGEVLEAAKREMNVQLARGNRLFGLGRAQVPAPVHNPDGTTTHTVVIGFSQGQVDLMGFFPRKLVVHPGDTVNFVLGPTDVAPHTVTFLNGGPDIPLVVGQPPVLLFNPEIVFPSQAGVPLSRTGLYNSGLLDPTNGPTSYSLQIGDQLGTYEYECLLHDTSGMTGILVVVPK